MMRTLLVALVLLLLIGAPAALANGGEGMETPQTADVLTLQGLAVLEQGLATGLATEKLDDALAAPREGAEVDRALVRSSRDAAAQGDRSRAVELLRRAFPADDSHVVGATFRPSFGGGEIGAAAIGALVSLLAVVGLLRRRSADRHRIGA